MKAIRARKRRQLWTAADIAVVRKRYALTPTRAIAAAIGRTETSIYQCAQELGLAKDPALVLEQNRALGRALLEHGRAHQFHKGQAPPNKGLRRPGWAPGRMAATQFKKGARPHTWKPVGSIRLNADGYVDRKVSDTGYPPRDWVGVHRLVWIQHRGPIPPGHKVVFQEGRYTTDAALITIETLELVSDADLMRRNSFHNRYPKEIALAIQTRGALVRQINKRSPEKDNGRYERRRERRHQRIAAATSDQGGASGADGHHQGPSE